jgi:phosphoglycolate phosphatase-like HAD superfamily hydrolase
MIRLISDFDGVIVDLSERYYQVYLWRLAQVRSPDQQITTLSKSDFWQLKQQKASQTEIALQSGLSTDQIPLFKKLRDDHAHRLENMVHDRPIPAAIAALQLAQDLDWEIMTVTMRRTSELAEAFRLYPELNPYFPGDRRFTIPDNAERNKDLDQKPQLLAQTLAQLPPHDRTWMVGDTEADIRAAQSHNIPAIAVLSGIRDRQTLETYQPDFIVQNLLEAVQLIQSRS